VAGGTVKDFSENNLKNYHGFDPGPCDGGNAYMSDAYLTRFSGPVAESADAIWVRLV
jgi:C1A family cysteine protease